MMVLGKGLETRVEIIDVFEPYMRSSRHSHGRICGFYFFRRRVNSGAFVVIFLLKLAACFQLCLHNTHFNIR